MQETESLDMRRHPLKTHLHYFIGKEEETLNINDITTLIGSVGFPIAMCVYMTVTFNKTLERLDDRILALSTRIDTLIDKALEKDDETR